MKPLLLTVGNVYVDHNIFGVDSTERPFRLKTGTDYFATSSERVLGGSAVNVAMQAARLGVSVGFIGKTGVDEGGQEVRALLHTEGILCDLMSKDASLATSMAVNLIDKNGEAIGLHYGDASRNLSATDFNLHDELFARCHAIYFGGTAKQPLLLKDGEKLFRALRSKGIKIFYDPNKFSAQQDAAERTLLLAQLAYVDGYLPNEQELLQLTGSASVDQALNVALGAGVGFVALKLGPKGCRIKTTQEDFSVQGHTITPLSTVGAGDCFNATFMAYYLTGRSLKECARLATAAAAIKVSKNIWPNEAAITALLGL
ncbi:MAG: carbohydrate kinase family protein [Candidatus Saccharimonadales bacterium]